MNCKPGDLAICLKDSRSQRLAGRMVEVLYFAPQDDFHLPDGVVHNGQRGMTLDSWVVKFNNPVSAYMGLGNPRRSTLYGCYPDKYLQPLRGDLDSDEVTTEERVNHAVTDQP